MGLLISLYSFHSLCPTHTATQQFLRHRPERYPLLSLLVEIALIKAPDQSVGK